MTKWVAVYTKSRHEQIVVNELNKKNIEAYCPMFKERRQWSDRKKWVHFPLFHSYEFANIEFQGKISIIHDETIENIKNILHGGFKIEQADFFFKGDQVIVAGGPLKGLEGIVQDIKGKNKLIIKIEAIKQAFSIEISSGLLKSKKKNATSIL